MPCKCKIIDLTAAPDDPCIICIQKHFLTADGVIHEFGHINNDNRNVAIRELQLALLHSAEKYPEIASRIHTLRRQIQYRQDIPLADWKTVTGLIDQIIEKELFSIPAVPANALAHSIPSIPSLPSIPSIPSHPAPSEKVYIFSNVKYPEKNKIQPSENDLLVFLNKAETIDFYADHKWKIVFHRDLKEDKYGKFRRGCRNSYVFNHPDSIPRAFIDNLKKSYDWDYKIEEEKDKEGNVKKVVKSMTTGYMVTKWMQQLYPQAEIILVNFGYEVQKSTYRCPWHNWKFEAEQLKSFDHLYLEEGKK